MKRLQIRVAPLFCVFALAVGIKNHVIIVPLVLQAARRDSWISALAAIPPLLIWAYAVFAIMKRTGQESLFQWFKSKYNVTIARLVLIPFLLMLVMILYITVLDSCTWTKVTYLPKTPFPVTVSLFVFASMLGAMKGLRTIVIASGVLLPFVILLGFFVMSVNFQFKDYTYVFPILSDGYKPVLHGMVYILAGTTEMILVLVLRHYMVGKLRAWTFLLVVLAITELVFGPILASITIFGPFEAADQRYPAFEQWRMVLIGKFISHLDFLSIYQWLSGSLIRLSISMFLIIDLLGLTDHKRKPLMLLGVSIALVYAVTGIKISDNRFALFLQDYYYPALFGFFYAFPFVLLAMIYAKRRNTAHATN